MTLSVRAPVTSAARALGRTTLLRGVCHYGNALLTRLPVASERRIDLSLPGCESRGAIDARLAWRESTIQTVATHLGLGPGERREQVRRLLSALQMGDADFALLLGDRNEWALWGRLSRRYFSAAPAIALPSSASG